MVFPIEAYYNTEESTNFRHNYTFSIVVLMDIRHPLKDLDQQMIEWAVSADLPVMLLLTKADKLSQSARSKQVKMVREAILPFQGDIQVEAFSAQNKIGIDKLAAKLDSWFSPLFS